MQVFTNALVYWNGTTIPQSSNITINVQRGAFGAEPFVATPQTMYPVKVPTWIQWSVALSAYYDSTDVAVENSIQQGQSGTLLVYPNLDNPLYLMGTMVVKSVSHHPVSQSYSEINYVFESGSMAWRGLSEYILTENGNHIVTEDGRAFIRE